MARRLGDPALRGWAARAGWLALWRSATLERRHALAVEELAAARESGDEAAEALGHVARAGTAVEEGDLETWQAEAAAAESIARRRRMVYVEFVLHFVRLNLALLEGDDSAAEAHAEAMRTMRDGIATPALEWTDFGVSYVTAMWRPEMRRRIRWLRGCSSSTRTNPSEIGQAPLLHVLALVGREDDVRAELATRPLQPMIDNWYVTADAGVRAIVAALLGDEALARQCRRAAPAGLGTNGGLRASPSSPARSTATSRSPWRCSASARRPPPSPSGPRRWRAAGG